MGSPLGARGQIIIFRRIGTNFEPRKQYGLRADGMKVNRLVRLFANVHDPRKNRIRYDRNGGREMVMK